MKSLYGFLPGIGVIWCYLMVSFYNISFDFMVWSDLSRVFFIIFGTIFVIIGLVIAKLMN